MSVPSTGSANLVDPPATRQRRPFSIRRLPGFTTIAIIVFVLLYVPIITLAVFSFNSGTSP